ncbi:MAG: hypothetical protein FWC73_14085 [Defluviitaleaceae bacterium]|nr:hypothetical protein [Defluviitaleaceae bacterium]
MAIPIDTRTPHDPCKKPGPIPSPIIAEPIIAHKVYDSCRAQDCATIVAYAAEAVFINEEHVHVGNIIPVPKGAGSVEIDHLILKKAVITNKRPAPFRKGFWDVEVKFVFEYDLTFRNCNREIIIGVRAFSNFTKKYHLFGSEGTDSTIATDFIGYTNIPSTGEPLAMAQAKAIALKAEFRCNHRDRIPVDVVVTIGIFSTMKLFRIVSLNVESKGFCIPRECEPEIPMDPCRFFDSLEFPTDTFAPPPKIVM